MNRRVTNKWFLSVDSVTMYLASLRSRFNECKGFLFGFLSAFEKIETRNVSHGLFFLFSSSNARNSFLAMEKYSNCTQTLRLASCFRSPPVTLYHLTLLSSIRQKLELNSASSILDPSRGRVYIFSRVGPEQRERGEKKKKKNVIR